MYNKQSFIAIILIACGTPHVINGELFSAVATKVIFDGSKAAMDYYYKNEEENTLLKKNLENYNPSIESCCEKNFTNNCHLLAQHCRKAEEHYKISTLQKQLAQVDHPNLKALIAEDLTEALATKKNVSNENQSYIESLSDNEQNELFKLMKALIKEHKCESNYAQEITKIHNALNK